MKPLTKRGIVEVQFNWIFILIAGGLILFFFMTIISYQQQLSKNKLGVELASQMELIFSGRGVSPGAKQPIDVADVPMQFDCSEYRVMDQRIASGNVLIFAPAEILTRKLMTLTMSFDVPLRTNTFIMITAPQIKYYFVGFTDEMKEKINNTLEFPLAPIGERIDYAFVKIENRTIKNEEGQEIAYENNPFVKFVFNLGVEEGGNPTSEVAQMLSPSFAEVDDAKVSAVVVNANVVEQGTSPLFFYVKNGNRFASDPTLPSEVVPHSFGYASFIGAVFVKDETTFSCIMNRALRRAKLTIEVAKGRYEKIGAVFASLPSITTNPCTVLAQQGVATLNALSESLNISEGGVRIADMNQFNQQIGALHQLNDDAVKSTCPAIY